MWSVRYMIIWCLMLELINIKKMNQSFDKQIFGQVVEVIRPDTSSLLNSKSNPLSSLRNASIQSEQNYSNSSLKVNKHPNQKPGKNKHETLTNYTDSNSAWRSGCEIRGLRKHKIIENSTKVTENSTLSAALKKVTGNDSFLCMCCEQEQSGRDCLACHGAGFTDGNNNIVKFIQYIMEFKLGIKKEYKNHTSKLQIVKDKQEPVAEKEKSWKTSKNIGSNASHQDKKSKKTISLTSKSSRINQFCSQFIKAQSPQPCPIQPQAQKQQFTQSPQTYTQKLKATQSTLHTNNFSFTNSMEQNNVSSINVGIRDMTQSIIDDNLNGSAIGSISLKAKGKEDKDMEQECYGYGCDKMGSSFGKQEPTTRSLLLTKSKPNICPTRQSIPQKQILSLSQVRQKLSLQNTIHNGFSCNQCEMDPIVGTRFHCCSFMCQDDYDLCEQCYRTYGHKHNMMEVRGKGLERICEGFQLCGSSKSIRYSTRLSVGAASGYLDESRGGEEGRAGGNNVIFKSSIH